MPTRRLLTAILVALPYFLSSAAPAYPYNPCVAAFPEDLRDKVSALSTDDLRLLIDEYIYQKNVSSNEQATSLGFVDGYKVGNALSGTEGSFGQSSQSKWRSEFEKTRHQEYERNKAQYVDIAVFNPEVIRALTTCIIATASTGVQSSIELVDACQFRFTVSYKPDKRAGFEDEPIYPMRLVATNATCNEWPDAPLAPNGDSVTCRRGGRGGATVKLELDRTGSPSEQLKPLPPPGAMPEPPKYANLLVEHLVYPKLSGNDSNQFKVQFDYDNGTVWWFQTNVDKTIADIKYEGCAGECVHVQACGVAGRTCNGLGTFAHPPAPDGGCKGKSSCRFYVWSDASLDRTFTLKVTEDKGVPDKTKCIDNCEYEKVLARWNELSKECPEVPQDYKQEIHKSGFWDKVKEVFS